MPEDKNIENITNISEEVSPRALKRDHEGITMFTILGPDKTKLDDSNINGISDNDTDSPDCLKKQILSEEDDLFVIDKFPEDKKDRKAHLSIPSYNKRINNVLSKEIKEDSPDPGNICARAMTCFNCEGSHNLRDCREPKNYGKINRNRKKTQIPMRYHVEDDQRFGHFRAGSISDSLRKALGLGAKQIPMHVYRMRVLGYPPGWLEEHKIIHSGLNMFDSQGKQLVTSDNEEEGEIVTPDQKNKYDINKLITYPGYNENPEPGTLDESQYYRVPPFNPMQNKSHMIERIAGNALESYKKRKLKMPESTPMKTNLEMADMDIGNDESPPPKSEPPKFDTSKNPVISSTPKHVDKKSAFQDDLAIHPPGISSDNSDYGSPCNNIGQSPKDSRSSSPSLADLEIKKKMLLAELNDTSYSPKNNDTNSNIDSLSGDLSQDISSIKLPEDKSDVSLVTADSPQKAPVIEYRSDKDENGMVDCPEDANQLIDMPEAINGNQPDDLNNATDNDKYIDKNMSSDKLFNDAINPNEPVELWDEEQNSTSESMCSLNTTPLRNVKSSSLGTPVISYSPYAGLPDANSFSKQIADVINFENLPDSVGKYGTIKGLLQKVRNALQDMK